MSLPRIEPSSWYSGTRNTLQSPNAMTSPKMPQTHTIATASKIAAAPPSGNAASTPCDAKNTTAPATMLATSVLANMLAIRLLPYEPTLLRTISEHTTNMTP